MMRCWVASESINFDGSIEMEYYDFEVWLDQVEFEVVNVGFRIRLTQPTSERSHFLEIK